MLELEAPNLHEIDLDRVIAFGHTWSPTLELAPPVPFFHGHAINIDMALSVTLAERRGHLSTADRDRVLAVMSGLGLALDSDHLTPRTAGAGDRLDPQDPRRHPARGDPRADRRAAASSTTSPPRNLSDTLTLHKKLCMELDRGGDGIDMFTAAAAAS